MTEVGLVLNPIEESFSQFEYSLNGEKKSFVHAMRRSAAGALSEVGLPTQKSEEYKYTPVHKLQVSTFEPKKIAVDPGSVKQRVEELLFGLDGYACVFVDGRFDSANSSLDDIPEGVLVSNLADAIYSHPNIIKHHLGSYLDVQKPFCALNTAFMLDGLVIIVGKKVQVKKPIYVLWLSSGKSEICYPRFLFVAKPHSKSSIVEIYASVNIADSCEVSASELVLMPNAELHHVRWLNNGLESKQVHTTSVRQDVSSRYNMVQVSLGTELMRHNLHVLLDGESSECSLRAIDIGNDSQHLDNFTVVEHAKPYCRSSQIFKGVFDASSTGVFCGRVKVNADAIKTDASQSNRNLVLSPRAVVNTRPQLEIDADDVKCSHGATVGQMDKDVLFFLRARGIALSEAKAMLTYAFAKEIIEGVGHNDLQQALEQALQQKLSQLSGE